MIEIASENSRATIQDLGRKGYRRYGVGTSGAMDGLALALGNILVGNDEGAAGIEIPGTPTTLRFARETRFALTGADARATLDGRPIPPWWTDTAGPTQSLVLNRPTDGTYTYLTVAGGIDVPAILGSRSTHLRGAFGGLDGRMLDKGDALSCGIAAGAAGDAFGLTPPRLKLPLGPETASRTINIRVLPAAEYARFTPSSREALWSANWKITSESNRAGYRLAGPSLGLIEPLEMRSHGLVPGVIQVPHGGQPIIQLADAYTAGGYPKIGTIIEADLWRVAQAPLGSALRFVHISYDEALTAFDALKMYRDRTRKWVSIYTEWAARQSLEAIVRRSDPRAA